MTGIPASIDLAIMFPPSRGLNGALTTIADASRYFRAGMAYPSKYLAVATIIRGNLERNVGMGRGLKARKRLAGIMGARMRVGTWVPTYHNPDNQFCQPTLEP